MVLKYFNSLYLPKKESDYSSAYNAVNLAIKLYITCGMRDQFYDKLKELSNESTNPPVIDCVKEEVLRMNTSAFKEVLDYCNKEIGVTFKNLVTFIQKLPSEVKFYDPKNIQPKIKNSLTILDSNTTKSEEISLCDGKMSDSQCIIDIKNIIGSDDLHSFYEFFKIASEQTGYLEKTLGTLEDLKNIQEHAVCEFENMQSQTTSTQEKGSIDKLKKTITKESGLTLCSEILISTTILDIALKMIGKLKSVAFKDLKSNLDSASDNNEARFFSDIQDNRSNCENFYLEQLECIKAYQQEILKDCSIENIEYPDVQRKRSAIESKNKEFLASIGQKIPDELKKVPLGKGPNMKNSIIELFRERLKNYSYIIHDRECCYLFEVKQTEINSRFSEINYIEFVGHALYKLNQNITAEPSKEQTELTELEDVSEVSPVQDNNNCVSF